MGHTVRVISIQATYPRPYYWAAKLLGSFIASKTGAVFYTKRESHVSHYEMDGIPITGIPMYKPIPHGKFTARAVKNAIAEIISDNEKNGFIPDTIVGHFVNPQFELLDALKTHYKGKCRTALIYHLPAEIKMAKDVYGTKYFKYLQSVDALGFRNEALRREFVASEGGGFNTFICYSGIPEDYITASNAHNFSGPKIEEYIYVGEMIERKYPAQILDAFHIAYPDGEFHINYVGKGQQIDAIRNKAKVYGWDEQVSVLGRIPRDEIKSKYDEAQCMIMISEGEAYGLVYLEAMARGCITIASRDEGFDGVIKDGENGFLCEAGNYKELAQIIERINALSPDERMSISENAIKTAKWLIDYNAAKMYIEDVMKF